MARKPLPLFRLNPGYDKRGHSPWHWLEADVPQETYFAFFSDRVLAEDWTPLTARMVMERRQGDFFFLRGLFAATGPAVEVVQGLLANKVEALPIRPKGKKEPPLFLLHPLEVAKMSSAAKVTRFKDGRIMYVDKFAFTRTAVAGKHFFSALGNHGDYVVSEEFRSAVEGAGLTGLGFGPLRGHCDVD